jgi:hypothetical protein
LANTTDEAEITKANAIVTANSDSKVYNGLSQNVNGFTASGLVNGETISVLTGVSGSTASGTNAGEYSTSLSGEDGNYNLTFVDGKLTITKANAIVTANSDSKVYNGLSQNVNGFTASGLVNGETISVLTGVSGSTASGTNAGEYSTSLSGEDGNYNLTFVDGKLIITPKPEILVEQTPVEQEKVKEIEKVITTIVNSQQIEVKLPNFVTDFNIVNNINGPSINNNSIISGSFAQNNSFVSQLLNQLNISEGQSIILVSTPIAGLPSERISMHELGVLSGNPSEVRVSLGNGSIVQLLNGGVNLVDGLQQEFYVQKTEITENNGAN